MAQSESMSMAHSMAAYLMDWRSRVMVGNPYDLKKTIDPGARNFDRSVKLFREGIRAANNGNLTTAKSKVAAAYLLDTRCARALVPLLPQGYKDQDPDASRYLMDNMTLVKIITAPSPASEMEHGIRSSETVLFLMITMKTNGDEVDYQQHSAIALELSKELLKKLKADSSSLENNPDINDGVLTQNRIHLLLGEHFESNMRNTKKMLKEYTSGIVNDPTDTFLRARRATKLYQYHLASNVKVIFDECQRVVKESHPDARYLRHIYAMMADLTLEYSAFGTFADAKSYFQKMESCVTRQNELYTELGVALECQDCFVDETRYKFGPEYLTEEKILERKSEDRSRFVRDVTSTDTMPGKTKGFCMNCDKFNGKLFKCGGCKQVSYCSRECQKADWKRHKKSCKMVKEIKSTMKK